MAQNHGSRARLLANVPIPNGPWAPFVAIAAVIATVALVANGPRIGGDSPAVPDGRAYATADSTTAGGLDRAAPSAPAPIDPVDEPSLGDREPVTPPPSTPRPRRRAPAASHRKRRTAPARPRTWSSPGRRPVPAPAPAPAPVSAPNPSATWRAEPMVRRAPTQHRTPISSAEREFGL